MPQNFQTDVQVSNAIQDAFKQSLGVTSTPLVNGIVPAKYIDINNLNNKGRFSSTTEFKKDENGNETPYSIGDYYSVDLTADSATAIDNTVFNIHIPTGKIGKVEYDGSWAFYESAAGTITQDDVNTAINDAVHGGINEYGIKTQLSNVSGTNISYYIKNQAIKNDGVLSKLYLYTDSSNTANQTVIFIFNKTGENTFEFVNSKVLHIVNGYNSIEVNLPVRKGQFAGIISQGMLFYYDVQLTGVSDIWQDTNNANGVYLRGDFTLGFGFDVTVSGVDEKIGNVNDNLNSINAILPSLNIVADNTNIFNKLGFIKDKIINGGGSFETEGTIGTNPSYADYTLFELTNLNIGETYTISDVSGKFTAVRICAYNSLKTFSAYNTESNNKLLFGEPTLPYTFTVPKDTTIVRMLTVNGDISKGQIQITKGNTVPTLYKDFKGAVQNSIVTGNALQKSRLLGANIRPQRLVYDWGLYGLIPFDMADFGGVNGVIGFDGITITSEDSGYNKYLQFYKVLDCREYTISADFIVKDGNTRVGIGTTGNFNVDAIFNFGIVKNPRIERNNGIRVQGNTDMESSVGDVCRVSLIHYYDKFTAVFENYTKGLKQIIGFNLDMSGATEWELQPIHANPRFTVQQGTVTLQNVQLNLFSTTKIIKTLVLGDSISSCFYCNGYLNNWQHKTFSSNNFTTLSGPGYRTDDTIANIDMIGDINPQYCLMYLGTNDCLQSQNVETFYKPNMRTLINYSLQRSITPILMTPGLITNGVDNSAYVQAVKDLGDEFDIKVIDISDANTEEDMFTDGVHPIQSGHLNIANKIKSVAPEIL